MSLKKRKPPKLSKHATERFKKEMERKLTERKEIVQQILKDESSEETV